MENLQNWEGDVVAKVLRGQSEVYETIVTAYQKSIYSLCCRMTGNPGDAEDLSQEVFIKAFRKLHTYDPSKRFSTWILTLGRNTCIDHLRRKKEETLPLDEERKDSLDFGQDSESPETAYLVQEEKDEIQQAVESLAPEYRILILLYHQQGKSYKEIAELEGLPLSLVKNRIHRGRKQLRDALQHLQRRERR